MSKEKQARKKARRAAMIDARLPKFKTISSMTNDRPIVRHVVTPEQIAAAQHKAECLARQVTKPHPPR